MRAEQHKLHHGHFACGVQGVLARQEHTHLSAEGKVLDRPFYGKWTTAEPLYLRREERAKEAETHLLRQVKMTSQWSDDGSCVGTSVTNGMGEKLTWAAPIKRWVTDEELTAHNAKMVDAFNAGLEVKETVFAGIALVDEITSDATKPIDGSWEALLPGMKTVHLADTAS